MPSLFTKKSIIVRGLRGLLTKCIKKSPGKLARATKKIADLELLAAEQREKIQEIQNKLDDREVELSELKKESDEWKNLFEISEQDRSKAASERDALQAKVAALKARAGVLSEEQIDALRLLANGQKVRSLSEALLLTEMLYSNRMVVLPSAWSSAKKARAFKNPQKAWELLHTLVTGYWNGVQNGGDSEGKKCFSDNNFAARESEGVEHNKRAKRLRTFQYNDNPLEMWKHLKIGTSHNTTDTWRCHFDFDSKTKKIIVGHCGKHLDFK